MLRRGVPLLKSLLPGLCKYFYSFKVRMDDRLWFYSCEMSHRCAFSFTYCTRIDAATWTTGLLLSTSFTLHYFRVKHTDTSYYTTCYFSTALDLVQMNIWANHSAMDWIQSTAYYIFHEKATMKIWWVSSFPSSSWLTTKIDLLVGGLSSTCHTSMTFHQTS